MADHYTLRLAPGTRERLSDRARRSGLAERTLAQRYLEEGLRHDAHPLIQFLDGPSGRRASLVGRGLDVWEIIATVRDNDGSVTAAVDYLQVPVGLVEAAVAYYGAADRSDLVGCSDRVILEIASTDLRAVVTNNIKDFRPLAAERLARGQSRAGLILLPSSRMHAHARRHRCSHSKHRSRSPRTPGRADLKRAMDRPAHRRVTGPDVLRRRPRGAVSLRPPSPVRDP